MTYIKTVMIGFLYFHFSYAATVIEPSPESLPEKLKSLAVQAHTIAESTDTNIEKRLVKTEHVINNLQDLFDTPTLLPHQKRYLVLLECFAWDLYEKLCQYQETLFVMEPDFKRQRPLVEVVNKCANYIIDKDIQNIALKEIGAVPDNMKKCYKVEYEKKQIK